MKPTARIARVFVLFTALIGTAAFAGAKQEQAPGTTGTVSDTGVLVVRVEPGSPAASAGIVRGDIILSVDGTDVVSGAEIRAAVSARKPGETAKVVVRHGDATRTFSVTLGELSGRAFLGVYFESGAAAATEPDADSGATVIPGPKTMPSLGNGPGILAVTGAQVFMVTAGSPAEKAGITVGDVITAVDGTDLARGDDLAAIISAKKPGDTVTLVVLGAKTEAREVKVTLGEKPQEKAKPWLGIEYRMAFRVEGATPWAGRLELTFGVRVTGVVDESPAAKAGIAKGDLLASVGGTDVRTAPQAVDAIAEHEPGETVVLGVVKAGESDVTEVTVTLAENPDAKDKAFLGVQLGGPWLAPGLPGPEKREYRVPGGRGGSVPGGAAPGGIDA
jgi:S1-C subfamily serine protease